MVAFVEAALAGDGSLDERRAALADTLSPTALVDAAAVVGNFERMNRIADGTGIPLEAPVAALSADIRDELGLGKFHSAQHTRPPGPIGRWLGRIAGALLPQLLRRLRR